MKQLIIAAHALLQISSFQDHQLSAFCRVITTNEFFDRYSPAECWIGQWPGISETEELVRDWLSLDDDYLEGLSRTLVLLRSLASCCHGRSLFLTRKGTFGLGPSDTRPGDIVTILLGCPSPMVFRPCIDHEAYSVVGEAYCDGFMDGEALLGNLPPPFTIRKRIDKHIMVAIS